MTMTCALFCVLISVTTLITTLIIERALIWKWDRDKRQKDLEREKKNAQKEQHRVTCVEKHNQPEAEFVMMHISQ